MAQLEGTGRHVKMASMVRAGMSNGVMGMNDELGWFKQSLNKKKSPLEMIGRLSSGYFWKDWHK